MAEEPLAHSTGAHRHHDVVDGGAERVLDRLDCVQRSRPEGEATVRGDAAVERGPRRAADRKTRGGVGVVLALTGETEDGPAQLAARLQENGVACGPAQLAQASGREPHEAHRPRGQVGQCAPEDLGVAGHGLRTPFVLGTRHGIPVGGLVEHHREQLGPRRSVDGGVVDLGEDAEEPVGHPLDHIRLPERASAVERSSDDARHDLRQLVVASGRRHRRVADVEVEVEVGVLDPERVVQVEGHLDQPAPQRLEEVEAFGDHRLPRRKRLVGIVGGPFVDRQAGDMAELRRRLHVEEGGVEPAELFHPGPLEAREK